MWKAVINFKNADSGYKFDSQTFMYLSKNEKYYLSTSKITFEMTVCFFNNVSHMKKFYLQCLN